MFHRLAVMASARSRPAFAGFVATPPAPTLRLGGVRQFAKRSRRRKLKNKRKDKTSTAPPAPLSKVMRLFVAKVHPDKFGAFPVQQEVNEESLSALTGFLSNVSNPEEDFMPAQKIAMKFYVQDDEQLKQVNFQLRTTGGDCKNLVKKQLTALFESVGVPQPEFTWDDKFWKSQESLERQNWDDDEDDDLFADDDEPAKSTSTSSSLLVKPQRASNSLSLSSQTNSNGGLSLDSPANQKPKPSPSAFSDDFFGGFNVSSKSSTQTPPSSTLKLSSPGKTSPSKSSSTLGTTSLSMSTSSPAMSEKERRKQEQRARVRIVVNVSASNKFVSGK